MTIFQIIGLVIFLAFILAWGVALIIVCARLGKLFGEK